MKRHFFIVLFTVVTLIGAGCQSTRTPAGSVDNLGFGSEKHLDFKKWNRSATCCTAEGSKVAVASGGENASKIGVAIFEKGGNVVDVAVAVALALGVERPQSTGLGGGGFMTVFLAKGKFRGPHYVDFRETAPGKATKDMFLDKSGAVVPGLSQDGALAVGTPGLIAGLYESQRKWGKLAWKQVVEPAIALAEKGFVIDVGLADRIDGRKEVLVKDEYAKKTFFHTDGTPLKAGETLKQPELAKTLSVIAAKGKNGFYQGPLAKQLSEAVRSRGGILSVSDLQKYKVRFREPIAIPFREYVIYTAPPPSAGGVIASEVFNVLGTFDLAAESADPVKYIHLLTEVMKRAYADRSVFIADQDFYKTAYPKLMTESYGETLRKSLNLVKATPSSQIRPGANVIADDHGTAHLSVIDADGNAVSSTVSLNGAFGAGIAVPSAGILLNNTMDDFSVKTGEKNIYGFVGTEGNSIQPYKRPVSSMMPTIAVEKETKTSVLAVGGGGGSRIISATVQVLLNDLIVDKGDLRRSVFKPRIHHQWLPDELVVEDAFSTAVGERLKGMGHTVTHKYFAEVDAAQLDPKTKRVQAVYDPRYSGGADAR